MGKVSGNWLTGTHSGRACRHDSLYTKVNKKTGKCYSVKLCNPNTDWSEDQLEQRSEFSAISSALSDWIKDNRAQGTEDYQKVHRTFERQNKYATLRGMMYAKGYATYDKQTGKVTITVGGKTTTSGGSGTSGGGGGNGELG